MQLLNDPGKIIAGTYSGFLLFGKSNGKWVFKDKIKGFGESSRDFIQDREGSIWISHGFKGIYNVRFNEEVDSVTHVSFYNSSNGLPTDFGMTLFRYKDSVYINTTKGIYIYDIAMQQFRKSALMGKLLGSNYYRKLMLDSDGNICYIIDSRAFELFYRSKSWH